MNEVDILIEAERRRRKGILTPRQKFLIDVLIEPKDVNAYTDSEMQMLGIYDYMQIINSSAITWSAYDELNKEFFVRG